MIDAFPPRYYDEYLNNATVQESVGAPLNHTDGYYALLQAFEHGEPYLKRTKTAVILIYVKLVILSVEVNLRKSNIFSTAVSELP